MNRQCLLKCTVCLRCLYLQTYIDDTPYRLGRGHTGLLTNLVVFNNTFVDVPGGQAAKPSRHCQEVISPHPPVSPP